MDSYVVFEIATLMAYMMNRAFHNDRLSGVEAASQALRGFQSIFPLCEEEKNMLYICMLKRMALSVCSGWHERSLGAQKETLKDMYSMGNLAQTLWEKSEKELMHEIFQSN